jgi:hypothetical protein
VEECAGFRFNLIRHGGCGFLQGSVIGENAPPGVFRNIAFLWEGADPGGIFSAGAEAPGYIRDSHKPEPSPIGIFSCSPALQGRRYGRWMFLPEINPRHGARDGFGNE